MEVALSRACLIPSLSKQTFAFSETGEFGNEAKEDVLKQFTQMVTERIDLVEKGIEEDAMRNKVITETCEFDHTRLFLGATSLRSTEDEASRTI